ncbi:hypothetical protein GE107_06115 [Cohnella sp. CFH 77786]|uniref:tetratricopeptide repeat protein n=1 Tax=Cohnella sp. CFH 77786 TaxID=2662265 RepID=UPI001C60C218|nr:tetratricopeptide repeat protein [Cohnella sp. CFH 77786]MBW5445638.1 hypothetical protein [Cohnella sp. CFH 77786]
MKRALRVSAWLALCLIVAAGVEAGVRPSSARAAEVSQPVWPVLLHEENDSEGVLPALRQQVKKELSLTEDEAGYLDGDPFYELNLGGMPAGYTRQFLAVTYHGEHFYLLLLASDRNAADIRTLDKVTGDDRGDLVINSAKIDVGVDGSTISVWSQAPFRAFQSEAKLQWDGSKLKVLSHEYSDPTLDFFAEKAELLKKGDLAGLLKLEDQPEGTYVMYPAFYEDYFALAAPTLRLAYKNALEAYKKGDAKTAATYLHYGLQQYTEPYGLWDWETGKLTADDLKSDANDFHPEGRLKASEFIPMLNDYAFFLSETKRYKEAKPILLNVIKLSPSRAVAYLNAADTEWALGEKKAAQAHYKQYLKLLGKNASKAPKRVQQRINAK